MSGEELTAKELNSTPSNNNARKTKVNINELLYKIRSEKNKERKENYMFLSLVIGILVVSGIIASL